MLRRHFSFLLLAVLPCLPGAAAQTPGHPVTAAEVLFQARRYAEAQIAFEEIYQTQPDHPQVLMYLGKLAAKRRDRVLALEYFTKAVELRPDDAEIQFEYGAANGLYAGSLGKSFSALRFARRASKAMERAIELAPDELTYRQGMIEFSLSAPAFAGGGNKRAYTQADAIAERDAAAGAFARASIHRAEGDHLAAMDTLEKLIGIAPDNYFARFTFGRCAAESGERLADGLRHLRHCLDLPAPDQAAPPAEVWWNIASIEKQRGHRDAAITALEKAVALAPQNRAIAADLADYLADKA